MLKSLLFIFYRRSETKISKCSSVKTISFYLLFSVWLRQASVKLKYFNQGALNLSFYKLFLHNSVEKDVFFYQQHRASREIFLVNGFKWAKYGKEFGYHFNKVKNKSMQGMLLCGHSSLNSSIAKKFVSLGCLLEKKLTNKSICKKEYIIKYFFKKSISQTGIVERFVFNNISKKQIDKVYSKKYKTNINDFTGLMFSGAYLQTENLVNLFYKKKQVVSGSKYINQMYTLVKASSNADCGENMTIVFFRALKKCLLKILRIKIIVPPSISLCRSFPCYSFSTIHSVFATRAYVSVSKIIDNGYLLASSLVYWAKSYRYLIKIVKILLSTKRNNSFITILATAKGIKLLNGSSGLLSTQNKDTQVMQNHRPDGGVKFFPTVKINARLNRTNWVISILIKLLTWQLKTIRRRLSFWVWKKAIVHMNFGVMNYKLWTFVKKKGQKVRRYKSCWPNFLLLPRARISYKHLKDVRDLKTGSKIRYVRHRKYNLEWTVFPILRKLYSSKNKKWYFNRWDKALDTLTTSRMWFFYLKNIVIPIKKKKKIYFTSFSLIEPEKFVTDYNELTFKHRGSFYERFARRGGKHLNRTEIMFKNFVVASTNKSSSFFRITRLGKVVNYILRNYQYWSEFTSIESVCNTPYGYPNKSKYRARRKKIKKNKKF